MEIKDAQRKVQGFNEARGWENSWDFKDLLLNITEEGGEIWNLVKWLDEEKQKEIVEKNKEQVSDYLGDTFYLLLKLANQTEINIEESIQNTLNEFEKRMPPEVMKKLKHANKFAGGWDNKKDLNEENKEQENKNE